MTKSKLIVRNATQRDIEEWYDGKPPFSVRAVVGELDGEVVAIGGVYRDREVVVGIAGLKDVMRDRFKDVVRMVRAGQKIMQDYAYVVAFASEQEPTADSFIRHLGFQHLKRVENGEMYLWTR